MKKITISLLFLWLIETISLSQIPNYIPAEGLMGWWPFNGNAIDESGNMNNGTVFGAVLTTDIFGSSNSAYLFNGIDSRIESPALDASSGNELTISVWIHPLDISSNIYYEIIRQDFDYTTLPDWLLSFQNYGTILSFGLGAGTYSELDIPITSSQYINSWHHIVARYDGSTKEVFKNGVLIGSAPKTGNVNYTSIKEHFGSEIMSEYFLGKIDDIGIWKRALTTSEISNIYINGTIGLEDKTINNDFDVYPNPALNQLNISINGNNDRYEYNLTDVFGKIILANKLKATNTTVDVSFLPKGIYFLTIKDSETYFKKKIVLE